MNDSASRPSRRVGIVEDNVALLDLYKTILKTCGHDVVFIAQSGEELVRAGRDGRLSDVEVLITDNRMARMSGLEAARIVTRHYPNIQIIIASAEDQDLEKVAHDSGFLFLRKPFSVLKLVDSVSG
ncbi:MAG: response regulator [archaeon]|nr:response regulator [archaeon]